MPRKTYGIYGKTAVKLDFYVKRFHLVANFHDGIPDQRTNRPAILVTDNGLAQLAIEKDPRFGRLVRLISSYPTAGEKAGEKALNMGTPAKREKAAAAAAPETGHAETSVHDECVTFNEVREVLMDLGATAKETLSKEACRATAARLNVTFPNWK